MELEHFFGFSLDLFCLQNEKKSPLKLMNL